MQASSRRSFLKTATAAAAVLSTGKGMAWADAPAGPVRVWSSYREKRHAASETLAWKPAEQLGAEAIVLNPAATRQDVLGFGAAMTDSSCYVLSQMSQSERDAVLHEMFSPREMGMNVCRTCIGASDYARNLYSFDESDTPDPELKRFSIDHDKAYILPVLREAKKHNPELFLFSSPWSPPGWMKPDKTMLGGTIRKTSFEPYARYFQKFLEGYKAEGVPIDAVTVQNETDAEQEGKMPACVWAQEAEMEFVAKYLGPALKKAGLGTKIWILDHNYSLWGRVIDQLSDPEVYEYADGVAWHGYVGDAAAMSRVHEAFPAKPSYWTEGGPDISQPDYQTDFTKWTESFNEILNNWARSITAWNLALDEKGNPNIGPFPCGGVVTVENGSHKVTRSGQYWAFAHFSRHVKRGAKVFATNGLAPATHKAEVSHSGFVNADGTHVVVVANRGAEKRVQLAMGTSVLELELPADSVHTLSW